MKKYITDKQTGDLKKIWRRILDISYKYKLSHIGSCLTMSLLLYQIYSQKKPEDKVILSAGHSGLALYVILEYFTNKNHEYIGIDAEKLFLKHGVHPNRDEVNGIWASSGSLGHGIGIGLGMAIANKSRGIHVLSTDGEMAEGSWWEALRIAEEQKVYNFYVYINANGYTAYSQSSILGIERALNGWVEYIKHQITVFETFCNVPLLEGLQGHYKVLNEKEYKEALEYI